MTKTRFWGLRVLCLLLSLACLIGIVPVAAGEQEPAKEQETIYTSLIYRNASTRQGVIGRMEDGTRVQVLGQRGDYYKINCYDMTGYIPCSQVKRVNDDYVIRCDPASSHTVENISWSVGDALLFRAAILDVAKTKLGKPYVYGGTGPNGFDCSGFTRYCYAQNGVTLGRVCSQQMQQSVIVSKDGLQVGDLIFFGTSAGNVTHVGIYAGDGKMIHAGNAGIGYADLNGVWFSGNYLCARRMIVVDTEVMQINAAAAGNQLGGHISIRSAR